MGRTAKLTYLLASIVINAGFTSAWWNAAHMVVASIAEAQLTPAAKSYVTCLLHLYEPFYPNHSTIQTSAVWADFIKAEGQGLLVFNHWHFIDKPIVIGQVAAPPDQFENAVWALQQAYGTLSSSGGDWWGKALALRLLIHIAGDIHQPLHSASRYSPLQPGGDEGGNTIQLADSRGVGRQSLHSYWDSTAGLLDSGLEKEIVEEGGREGSVLMEDISRAAEAVTNEEPRTHFDDEQVLSSDFGKWAEEGRRIAEEHVYIDVFSQDVNPTVPLTISPDYEDAAQLVVGRQLALAGYRLGFILNSISPESWGELLVAPSLPISPGSIPEIATGRATSPLTVYGRRRKWALIVVALFLVSLLIGPVVVVTMPRERHIPGGHRQGFKQQLLEQGQEHVASQSPVRRLLYVHTNPDLEFGDCKVSKG